MCIYDTKEPKRQAEAALKELLDESAQE